MAPTAKSGTRPVRAPTPKRGPTAELERAAGAETGATVFGVDEVGRGPLAGPVVTGAAWIDVARMPTAVAGLIADSKVLSADRRASALAAAEPYAVIALGRAEVAEIDATNILAAALTAMGRAVEALVAALGRSPDLVLVDGNRLPKWSWPAEAVVKGDSRSISIALAAIAAKQARDAEMTELSRLHPGYGWERNAGYGTAAHKAALAALGPTPHHRRSFAPVRAALAAGADGLR
ncbi:MAG: ribonuclease HII [Alphaproteobacteria bacterium]|nr:ribonuclease HII [Alphaproteobacteria bacterium]